VALAGEALAKMAANEAGAAGHKAGERRRGSRGGVRLSRRCSQCLHGFPP
jgi:hypothetical protein